MEDKEGLFSQLEAATSQDSLENAFQKYKVTKVAEKKAALLECKGLRSFYSPGYHDLTIEEQYKHEAAIFLAGKWKLKKEYAKLRNH